MPGDRRHQADCLPAAPRGLPEIVSARPGDEELRRIQALTVIFATTPNPVIREARGFFLSHTAAACCHQAAGACRRRQRGGRPL